MDIEDLFTKLRRLLILAMFCGGVFLLGRESWLHLAAQNAQSALDEGVRVSKLASKYKRACPEYTDQNVSGAQLRFLDSNKYVIEARCTNSPVGIKISEGKLFGGVRRVAGYSGLILGDSSVSGSALQLEFLGRQIQVNVGDVTNQPVHGPVAECAGWGYSCCATEDSVGQGSRPESPALDCAESCYQICRPRAQVFSFRTDPPYDAQTRVLSLTGATAQVQFVYVTGMVNAQVAKVTIEFGDGKQVTLDTETDSVMHTYTCSTGTCTYTAKIMAADALGNTSLLTPISSLMITLRH